ncbi:MAG: bifunctional nuclease family protein [Anaerolineae bacterium]
MIEVELFSVMSVRQANHWVILLKEKAGPHYLPIWTGSLEARPILLWMGGVTFQRPMTHDLLLTAVERLGAKVTKVAIYGLEKQIVLARIILDKDGQEVALDSRPSDAIALAVRRGIPILVAHEIMQKAGVVLLQRGAETRNTSQDDDRLRVFREFINSLEMNDF